MKTFVVVNPAAAGGRAGRYWPSISRELADAIGKYEVALTTKAGDATTLVRNAVAGGAGFIIAVGGDGTVNEAVNGLCDGERSPSPDVSFGFVMCGTGGDFRRSFDLPKDMRASIGRLQSGHTQVIDLGRLRYVGTDGAPALRWFNNISSFGFSGEVVRAVNAARYSKLLGGKFSFLWNSFLELRKYRGCLVDITVDGKTISDNVCTAAICNGRYFGGGMKMAPNAVLDDGHFDVVIVRQEPPLSISTCGSCIRAHICSIRMFRFTAERSSRPSRCRTHPFISTSKAKHRVRFLQLSKSFPERSGCGASLTPTWNCSKSLRLAGTDAWSMRCPCRRMRSDPGKRSTGSDRLSGTGFTRSGV